jgi:hypothetical protein
MKLAALLGVALGASCVASMVACGSSGVADYRGGGGNTASAVPDKADGGKSGGSSSGGGSTGGSGGGSSQGGSGGGSTSTGNGGSTTFGNVTVASFTLIDTAIDTLPAGAAITGFDPMAYGTTLDLAKVGYKLSMVVSPPEVAAVGSMAFALDATFTHTANTAPYSLCGDDGKGTFAACPISVGKHTLTVTVYPESNLGGAPYQPPTVFEFTVVDSSPVDDGGTD